MNMKRRTERVSSLVRDVLGQILLSKISDPRIDPARVSVTRVEMPEDLLTARVFVSVMGSESQQRNVLRALQHASGRIQELLYEDQPYTWLFWRNSFYGFSKQLRGYVFSPRGPFHYSPGFSSLWMPRADD